MKNDIANFDALCHSIDTAQTVPEAKQYRDKAIALVRYYKTQCDTEAADYLAKLRLRAERKIGELTKKMPTAPGNQHKGALSKASTKQTKTAALAEAGISKQDASDYEGVAAIPADQFEAELANPKGCRSAHSLAQKSRKETRKMSPKESEAHNPNWEKYSGKIKGLPKGQWGPREIYGNVQTEPTHVIDARRRSQVAAELTKALRYAEESAKAAIAILDDGFDVCPLADKVIVHIESPEQFAKDIKSDWREHFIRRFDALDTLIERLRQYRTALGGV